MRTLVLSLARTPERLERFRAANAATGIAFEVFPAVDGSTVSTAQAVADGAILAGTRGYKPGGIGNALSHRAIWREAAAASEPTAVFEDDIVLRHDAAARIAAIPAGLPPGWEIVMLGYNTDTLLELKMGGGSDLRGTFSVHNPSEAQLAEFARGVAPVGVFPLNHAFGMGAYLISPAGARALADLCFPMNDRLFYIAGMEAWFQPFGIDGMLNAVFRDRAAYACFPPLAWSRNDVASSTVQTA